MKYQWCRLSQAQNSRISVTVVVVFFHSCAVNICIFNWGMYEFNITYHYFDFLIFGILSPSLPLFNPPPEKKKQTCKTVQNQRLTIFTIIKLSHSSTVWWGTKSFCLSPGFPNILTSQIAVSFLYSPFCYFYIIFRSNFLNGNFDGLSHFLSLPNPKIIF